MLDSPDFRKQQIVSVGSHSSELRINHRFFFKIPDSLRKVLTNFKTSLNRLDRLGNRISWFMKFSFLEQQLGHFALFGSVLSHSESELHSVYFFGFLTL